MVPADRLVVLGAGRLQPDGESEHLATRHCASESMQSQADAARGAVAEFMG